MFLLAPFWFFLQTKMTVAKTLSYPSNNEIPGLAFIYLNPEKDIPFGRSLPEKAIKGSIPPLLHDYDAARWQN